MTGRADQVRITPGFSKGRIRERMAFWQVSCIFMYRAVYNLTRVLDGGIYGEACARGNQCKASAS